MSTEHPNVVLSRQHFDLMADQYDELFVMHMHDYDITHEMILTMLPFSRESALRVLELGTGTGNLTQKLLDRFPQSTVVGYDVSAEMLTRARAKLASAGTRVQLHQGDQQGEHVYVQQRPASNEFNKPVQTQAPVRR